MSSGTYTNEISQIFLDFVQQASSPYHTIDVCKRELLEQGFEELDFTDTWNLVAGTAYFTILYGTTLFAFRVPEECTSESIFRITASHTDHPGLRIKPNPDIHDKGYHKLNVDVYGGAILNTWLDRPLSIAGKVTLRSSQIFSPITKLVDFKRPLLTIPNLAIHMNRNVNTGQELNKQIDLLPLLGLDQKDSEISFVELLADELNVSKEDVIDFDLSIYNAELGTKFGKENELYSCPRLDNLTSVFAGLRAITMSDVPENDFVISAFYDNEEIGSKTKQGADSSLTNIFLKKICHGLSFSDQEYYNMLLRSYMISADVAHALHPNHPEKNDITNYTKLNQGIVIKLSSTQRYATDTEAIGMIQQLCEQYAIPYQKFVNRSDIPGGSTLGTITSSWLPIHTIDLGIPILAMHSARETAGVQDEISLIRLFNAFYSCDR